MILYINKDKMQNLVKNKKISLFEIFKKTSQ